MSRLEDEVVRHLLTVYSVYSDNKLTNEAKTGGWYVVKKVHVKVGRRRSSTLANSI